MKNWLSNRRVLALGLVAVIIFTVITFLNAPGQNLPPLSIRSDAPDGALALRRWLQKDSTYQVRELTAAVLQPEGLEVLFILDPAIPYSEGEAQVVADWVARGNTLIVVGEVESILRPYRVSMQPVYITGAEPVVSSVSLRYPPVENMQIESVVYTPVFTRDTRYVPHLFWQDQPIVVSFGHGQGQVWLVGTRLAFTNQGLQHEANARFILNLLAEESRRASIGIDEAQHHFDREDPLTLSDWFFRTPGGWSVLSLGGLTLVFLGLRGRRFGRSLPLPETRLRREFGEYIQAMASLLRRTGQRGEILKHYDSQLRRVLARRYGLDPSLPGEALLRSIQARDLTVDTVDLNYLLQQLQRRRVTEKELILIVSQVDEWLHKLR